MPVGTVNQYGVGFDTELSLELQTNRYYSLPAPSRSNDCGASCVCRLWLRGSLATSSLFLGKQPPALWAYICVLCRYQSVERCGGIYSCSFPPQGSAQALSCQSSIRGWNDRWKDAMAEYCASMHDGNDWKHFSQDPER